MAQSKFETRGRIHPDDYASANWLNYEGNKALRYLRRHGACRDLGPAIFFPEKGESALDAYAVCAGCVVKAACLAFALSTTERDGVWGGTNEVLRRPLMRRIAAGEDPDVVAASYCSTATSTPARRSYSSEVKAEALRICAEAGPAVASEAIGVPYTTVKSWVYTQREAERRAAGRSRRDDDARGDTKNMTDAEVAKLVEQAVQTATALVLEQLNVSLAETTAELLERLDMLTGVVSASLTVLAPLDPALADAAAMVDGAPASSQSPPRATRTGSTTRGRRMARPAGLKRERELLKDAKARRNAADRAERRAAKRFERAESRPVPPPPAQESAVRHAQPQVESPAIPMPRCAVCGSKAPRGVWLADFHNWPDGPRWVHRSCVGRWTREAGSDASGANDG